jgi:hypothetical protein
LKMCLRVVAKPMMNGRIISFDHNGSRVQRSRVKLLRTLALLGVRGSLLSHPV